MRGSEGRQRGWQSGVNSITKRKSVSVNNGMGKREKLWGKKGDRRAEVVKEERSNKYLILASPRQRGEGDG